MPAWLLFIGTGGHHQGFLADDFRGVEGKRVGDGERLGHEFIDKIQP